jgi:hypothetical protein
MLYLTAESCNRVNPVTGEKFSVRNTPARDPDGNRRK